MKQDNAKTVLSDVPNVPQGIIAVLVKTTVQLLLPAQHALRENLTMGLILLVDNVIRNVQPAI